MSDCVYVDSDSCHGTSSYKLSNEKYIEVATIDCASLSFTKVITFHQTCPITIKYLLVSKLDI